MDLYISMVEDRPDLCQRIREAISTETSQKRSLFEAYVSSVCAIWQLCFMQEIFTSVAGTGPVNTDGCNHLPMDWLFCSWCG